MQTNSKSALGQAKAQAARVLGVLAHQGHPVKHSQALEVVAAVHGHANWHAYRASLLAANTVQASALRPERWIVISMALYAQDGSDQVFLGKREILARSFDDARSILMDELWDPRLDAGGAGSTLCHEVLGEVVATPTVEDYVRWLQEAGYESDALDAWILDEAIRAASNASSNETEREFALDEARRHAEQINREGLASQVSFLETRYPTWSELVERLRKTFQLTGWPFETL